MNEGPVITVRNVSFSYDGKPVLEEVNLSIYNGEFLSMVGPNGGGKTTLLKIMLGLLKPNSGEVRIFGKLPERSLDLIGYMPQYPLFDSQFPVSVMDVVLMGRLRKHSKGLYTKIDKEVVIKALEEVEMAGFYKHSFSSLSGGERQRVLLSRALVGGPKILLLDEPTANVDLEMEHKLYATLKELNKRMTIIMVTHDLGFVSQIVQRVICVKKKVAIHPTSEISGKLIQEIYGYDIHMVRHDWVTRKDGYLNG